MAEKQTMVEIHGICKSFDVTKAVDNVSISVKKGEIHGLIGENGSGKSTLAAVIAGIYQPDNGELFLEGKSYSVRDSIEAFRKGICIVVQEKGTFLNTNVAENIFLGVEDKFKVNGLINNKKMQASALDVLNAIGADHIDPAAICSTLSLEDRKLIEIARIMTFDPKLSIIDETTTALTKKGRAILYRLITRMRNEGKSIILISHDIDEIFEYSDRLTILRDGKFIKTLERKEFSAKIVKQLMVGRNINDQYYRSNNPQKAFNEDNVILSAQNVHYKFIKNISIDLHEGEILGFGGLTDSGMHEIGKIMFGALEPEKGKVVTRDGVVISNPTIATKQSIAYLSKDRDKESLLTIASVYDNICLPSLPRLRKKGFITNRSMKNFASVWSKKLEIKIVDVDQYVNQLSGGNKQKVSLAKWLAFDADIFIMDCPTRGIDVGVKAAIYKLMAEIRAAGKSIVMISEELPELLGMCDNIVIFKSGEMTRVFKRGPELNEKLLIEYMV